MIMLIKFGLLVLLAPYILAGAMYLAVFGVMLAIPVAIIALAAHFPYISIPLIILFLIGASIDEGTIDEEALKA